MSTLNTMYAAQPNSPFTTTLGEISASDTAVVVADASVLPETVPFLLTFGYDKSASETVLVTEKEDNTLTIVRAVDGNALLWVAGTKCARIFTAKDLNDVQANIETLNAQKQEKITAPGIVRCGKNGDLIAEQSAIPILNITSSDGVTYTATAPNLDLMNGMVVVLIPNMTSTTVIPKLNINNTGGVYMELSVSSATGTAVVAAKSDWLIAKRPCIFIYRDDGNSKYWMAVTTRPRGETVTGGAVGIEFGGTGATTAAAARTNLDAQQKLIAGNNITLDGNRISAKDGDVGDLKESLGTPNSDWIKCDGRTVLGKDYPELMNVLEPYAKRWNRSGNASGLRFVNGKLLVLVEKDLWEYDTQSEDWIVHANAINVNNSYLRYAAYKNGKWQLAVGWMTLYVFEASSLDGPWTRHGPYGSASTVYPLKVVSDGAGGFVFAGYNFSMYFGIGHIKSDYTCTITMLDETLKYDEALTLNYANNNWLVTGHSKDGVIRLFFTDSLDDLWTQGQIKTTPMLPRELVPHGNAYELFVSNNAYNTLAYLSAPDITDTWTYHLVSGEADTPFVEQLVADGTGFVGVGRTSYHDRGTFILTRDAQDNWQWYRISNTAHSTLSVAKLDEKIFVTGCYMNESFVGRFEDLNEDLTGDAYVPDYEGRHGTVYIKGR